MEAADNRMEYRAIAWIQDSSDFNAEDCVDRLKRRFPEAQITSANNIISIGIGNFSARLYLEREPHVALEAQEFAGLVPTYRCAAELAKCHTRISVICNEAETMMERFNDFLVIGETLQEFNGVMVFDLASFTPFRGQ